MKSIFLFLLLHMCITVCYGQIAAKNLYKTWIKFEVKFAQGDTLPEGYTLKNDYLKYTFNRDNTLNLSTIYHDLGDKINFNLSHNIIATYTESGMVLNQLMIKKLSKDTLVLLQRGRAGFEDPYALVFYLQARI